MSVSLKLVWRGSGAVHGAGRWELLLRLFKHCLKTIVVGSCTPDSERTMQARDRKKGGEGEGGGGGHEAEGHRSELNSGPCRALSLNP